MKKGWEMKTLGEIADVKGGKRVPKGYQLQTEPTNHPYITVSDFTDDGTIDMSGLRYVSEEIFQQIKRYTISSKDLYLSIAGTIGKTGYVPDELDGASLTENACKLVLHPGTDRNFLHYFTKSSDFADQAGANTRTAAQPKLALERLKTIKLCVPPLAEQQRIVGLLGEAFEGLATAKANVEKNLKNARALFESYLQSVFTKRGEGWVERKFDEVCVLQRGFDLPTHSRKAGVFPLVSSNGITDRIDIWKAKAPGVVTGRSGTIGNVHFIEEDYWPLNTALYIKDFHGNYERCVYYLLKQFDLSKYSSGAGVPTLNRNNVHSVKVWFPKLIADQKHIVAKLDTISAETKYLESIYQQKRDALDDLKKSLLHKAFSGGL
jgi:type I restriction enzyme S subunit